MSLVFKQRPSDSPFVELITQGETISSSATTRPSEIHWHMVFVKHQGGILALTVGPLTAAGEVQFVEGVELLWIKFKLGVFMPHLPIRNYLDGETTLPDASSRSFWLKGAAMQIPAYHNVESFIDRLVRDDVLVHDPLVSAALRDQLPPKGLSPRTVRHRFQQATGLSQTHILQYQRAQEAAALLEQGMPILDVVFQLGYYDQPHLTRSLKRFMGITPARISVVD
jgi:hypothetical protein